MHHRSASSYSHIALEHMMRQFRKRNLHRLVVHRFAISFFSLLTLLLLIPLSPRAEYLGSHWPCFQRYSSILLCFILCIRKIYLFHKYKICSEITLYSFCHQWCASPTTCKRFAFRLGFSASHLLTLRGEYRIRSF